MALLRRTLASLLAVCLILCAVPTAEAALAQYVFDYADILTDSEELSLNALAREYSEELGVHFVILTANDESEKDLETYSRNFFEGNIMGVDGIYECAMMTVNLGTRRVANDFYGELRTMISDYEASVIRDGYTADMSAGYYADAARYFLDEAAALVERKFALYHTEVPEVETYSLVYDFRDALSADELAQLSAGARELTQLTGVGHIIVITDDYGDEEYLNRYANSFYKKNFQDEFGGAFVLAVSVSGRAVSVSPFGSYSPVNSVIWDMKSALQPKIDNYLIYESCQVFLSRQADAWQAEHLILPEIDYSLKVYDYADVLSAEEAENLRAIINERQKKYGVDFLIVLSEYSGTQTLDALRSQFWNAAYNNYEWEHSNGNFILLVIGSPPQSEGERQYFSTWYSGPKVHRKIGFRQEFAIYSELYYGLITYKRGEYAACIAMLDTASTALGSLIPNVRMADEFGWAVQTGLIAGITLSLLTILVMFIMQRSGLKRKLSARNYLVNGSVRLNYSRDVFLYSHTTQRKIHTDSGSSSSGSSGGSSGSSGGGTSSRSEGSF